MIRSYEQQGLLSSQRSAAGYRFGTTVRMDKQLSFIRQLQFGLCVTADPTAVAAMAEPQPTQSAGEAVSEQQLIDVTDKSKLQQMQQQLQQLVLACSDNEQPDRAIQNLSARRCLVASLSWLTFLPARRYTTALTLPAVLQCRPLSGFRCRSRFQGF